MIPAFTLPPASNIASVNGICAFTTLDLVALGMIEADEVILEYGNDEKWSQLHREMNVAYDNALLCLFTLSLREAYGA